MSLLHEVVHKAVAYVKEQATVGPIFAKLDQDKSGALDATELLPLLKMIAGTHGIDQDTITMEDSEFVMRLADTDKSGAIERNEIMLASATWKNLLVTEEAPSQKHGKQTSSACALL